MSAVLVVTLGEIVALGVLAALILWAVIWIIDQAIRQSLCPHKDLDPPATSFGGDGHGWRCKKCGKDLGWEKPNAS